MEQKSNDSDTYILFGDIGNRGNREEVVVDVDVDADDGQRENLDGGRSSMSAGQVVADLVADDEHATSDSFLPRSVILDRELKSFVPADISNEILGFVGVEPLVDWKEENKLVKQRVMWVLLGKLALQACVAATTITSWVLLYEIEFVANVVVACVALAADPVVRFLLVHFEIIPTGVAGLPTYVSRPFVWMLFCPFAWMPFLGLDGAHLFAHVFPATTVLLHVGELLKFHFGRVAVPRRVHDTKQAKYLADRGHNKSVGRAFVISNGIRMNEIKPLALMQPPSIWPIVGPLRKRYFEEQFDIVSVEAFAYKNAYTLCFTNRRQKYPLWFRIFCCACLVGKEEKIYAAMDPTLLGVLNKLFCHYGREAELDELWRHLRRNLKEVPTITHQLCFANMSVMFKRNGQDRIRFFQQ